MGQVRRQAGLVKVALPREVSRQRCYALLRLVTLCCVLSRTRSCSCEKWASMFDGAGLLVVCAGAFVSRGRGGIDRGARGRGRGIGAAPVSRGGAGGAFTYSRGASRGGRNVAFEGSGGRGSYRGGGGGGFEASGGHGAYRGGGGFSRGAGHGGMAVQGNAEEDFHSVPSLAAA